MDQDLSNAAEEGNIEALYSSLRKDASVLNKIDDIPFVQTPLHAAASAGQTAFVMEIMILKPSFARKLNLKGFTPMHLALQNNQTQVVLRLLDVDKDLVRVQGKGGATPLHFAAETGNVHLLVEFLKACPKSIEDVTTRRETALHIALKNDRIDALQVLLGWLRRAWFLHALSWENKLLKWKDEEGNTLLHIAVSKGLPQVVRWLLNRGVDVNSKNLQDFTVLDILQRGTQRPVAEEIKNMLCNAARASSGSCLPRDVASLADYLRSSVALDEKFYIFFLRQKTRMTEAVRNALLVVAVLLVTVCYQAAVSPPGGVWQDNYNPRTNLLHSTATSSNSSTVINQPPHFAGTVVMSRVPAYIFLAINSLTFYLTTMIIIFLLPFGFITRFLLYILLLSLFLCYYFSMAVIIPTGTWLLRLAFLCFLLLFQCLPMYLASTRRRVLLQAFLPIAREYDPTFS